MEADEFHQAQSAPRRTPDLQAQGLDPRSASAQRITSGASPPADQLLDTHWTPSRFGFVSGPEHQASPNPLPDDRGTSLGRRGPPRDPRRGTGPQEMETPRVPRPRKQISQASARGPKREPERHDGVTFGSGFHTPSRMNWLSYVEFKRVPLREVLYLAGPPFGTVQSSPDRTGS